MKQQNEPQNLIFKFAVKLEFSWFNFVFFYVYFFYCVLVLDVWCYVWRKSIQQFALAITTCAAQCCPTLRYRPQFACIRWIRIATGASESAVRREHAFSIYSLNARCRVKTCLKFDRSLASFSKQLLCRVSASLRAKSRFSSVSQAYKYFPLYSFCCGCGFVLYKSTRCVLSSVKIEVNTVCKIVCVPQQHLSSRAECGRETSYHLLVVWFCCASGTIIVFYYYYTISQAAVRRQRRRSYRGEVNLASN